jgi:ABC-type lipoprotein export system ATPase subunit
MVDRKHPSKQVNVGNHQTFPLNDINLSVNEGEFVSVMGPSGSAKSTLLNIIGMLASIDEREYFFYTRLFIS